MDAQALDRIQSALQVRLPEDYRTLLLDYPFPTMKGNDDSPLFDDPEAVLDLNRKYRAGFAGMKPWPASYLFIGDDGAAGCYALDLARTPSKVLFLDHGDCEASQVESESLAAWVEQLKKELGPSASLSGTSRLHQAASLSLFWGGIAFLAGIIAWILILKRR